MNYEELYCIGCRANCEILPVQEFKVSQCLITHIYIWPVVNYFFEKGILSIINSTQVISSFPGFIFVDFSWKNIKYFLNDEWIRYLTATKMRIILMPDEKMAPLATYYNRNENAIYNVIYLSEGLTGIRNKIKKLFIGMPLLNKVAKELTKNEKDVLYLTLQQVGVREISKRMSLDVKAVYNIRQRVENKIGMKIRRFS